MGESDTGRRQPFCANTALAVMRARVRPRRDFWLYRGLDDDPISTRRVSVPTGVIYLPHEMLSFKPPKSVLERNFNLVRFTQLTAGGHFAFWEQPGAMTEDVRQFFRPLRA